MQTGKIPLFILIVFFCVGCTKKPLPDIRTESDASGRITSMSFIGRNVTDSDLKQLSNHSDLQTLCLQECSNLSDKAIAEIKNVAPSLVKVQLMRVPVSDDGLACLASAKSLEELHLAHANVSGEGLHHLARTPLKKLAIHSRVVTPEGMAALGDLHLLQYLELQCQNISLKDLPVLGQLKHLQSLVAFRTPVGAGGINVLSGLTKLRKLMLNSSDINDESTAVLNTLVGLEEVELSNTTITDSGIKQLSLPNIKKLSLDGSTKITDAALANFQGMPKLESLMLGGTSVSGVDLTPLASLTNLKELLLMGKQFKGNDDTIKAFNALLPTCEVIIMRG